MTEFQKKLARGDVQHGVCAMYPAPGIIERIGKDWDWIWVDGQHGQWSYDSLLHIVRTCDLIGRPPFVRVPSHEWGVIGRALDCAPAGVIVPCVDTPEQAQRVVDAAKFPPLGKRSYGGRRPCDVLGRGYSDSANEDLMLICQIESPEAIANVDDIVALPGVDALFLGPDDVMLRRGYEMGTPTRNRDTLGGDMNAVSAACSKHGKIPVMVGAGEEMLRLCLEMDFRMVVGASDVMLLSTASTDFSERARSVATGADSGI